MENVIFILLGVKINYFVVFDFKLWGWIFCVISGCNKNIRFFMGIFKIGLEGRNNRKFLIKMVNFIFIVYCFLLGVIIGDGDC